MSKTTKPLNLLVAQGKTFQKTLRVGDYRKTYKAITGITQAAPVVVTAAGHDLVDGWPAYLESIVGPTDLNRRKPYPTRRLTNDTFELVNINGLDLPAYVSGGVVAYNPPISLAGLTAALQIRDNWDTPALLSLTHVLNGNGSAVLLDDVTKTVTIQFGAADLALLDPNAGKVYDVELTSGSVVICPAWGYINVRPESTKS